MGFLDCPQTFKGGGGLQFGHVHVRGIPQKFFQQNCNLQKVFTLKSFQLYGMSVCSGGLLDPAPSMHQMDTGYIVWSFQGKLLYRSSGMDKFCQLFWRPRPPSLLTEEDLKVGGRGVLDGIRGGCKAFK